MIRFIIQDDETDEKIVERFGSKDFLNAAQIRKVPTMDLNECPMTSSYVFCTVQDVFFNTYKE